MVFALPALLAFAIGACSPGYVGSDSQSDGTGGGSDEGSGGMDGVGGSDGTGGSDTDTGGSSSSSGGSEPGSGGADPGSGGSGTSTGGADSSCSDGDACIAAANFHDECFKPDCSSPIAATADEVARDPCLVPWDERSTTIPEECAASSPPNACPTICEVQPPCVAATCSEGGQCEIVVCLP